MKQAISVAAILLILAAGSTLAETYQVGSGRTYETLQDITGSLNPGDVVEVDGDATYPADVYITRSGNADNRITVRGTSGASRPVITGSGDYGIYISGDYVILEGFEIDGGPKGIGVFGDNIIVRNCVIHDCNHGLIGYGTGTGNVTVEYCEFYGNGVPTGGATQHQIYMATDEDAHPGSTFRLQFCYLHDAVEGDNVKSRSERNEIYYNWVELAGTSGHGLGLFAPDPEDNSNVSIGTAREDADVVGNVIIQDHNSCARIGGDLENHPTNGRYRFVNNTFILTGSRGDAIRTFNTIETLEMYNNVVYAAGSGDFRVVNDNDGSWLHSPRSLIGSNNWVIEGATHIPTSTEWTNTYQGSSSPFVDAGAKDFRPLAGGPLENAGTGATPTITAYPFDNPLFPPAFVPPVAELIAVGTEQARADDGSIDIGAFEESSAVVNRGFLIPRNATRGLPAGYTVRGTYGVDGRLIGKGAVGAGLRIVWFHERTATGTDRSTVVEPR